MLNLSNTRIVTTEQLPVATGVVIEEEGMALEYVREGDAVKVIASTGTAGAIFAGVSYSRNSAPAALPVVSTSPAVSFTNGVDPLVGRIILPRNPIAGALSVRNASGVLLTQVAANAVLAAGEYKVGNLFIDVHSTLIDTNITATYRYAPTVLEARSVLGDAPQGGLPSTYGESIGVIKNAVLGTSFFDASADWSTAIYVRTLSGGLFAPATSSNGIKGVSIRQAPNAGNPFLVLSVLTA